MHMRIIVDTMELYEIAETLIELSADVVNKSRHSIDKNMKCYTKVMKNVGEQKRYFKPIPISLNKAPNVNFFVIPNCNGKRDLSKFGVNVLICSVFNYKGYKYYSLIINNFTQISIYSTHFLERYIERHLKDNSKPSIDIFIDYLKETDGICNGFQEVGRGNECLWPNKIGSTCGEVLSSKVLLHKTFIDSSTIRKGQKREALDKSKTLDKYMSLNAQGNRILNHSISKYFNFKLCQ